MIKKGIILAGGMGTRMSPLTKAVNKQLLPIYNKPLIFYPLSILMLAKIKNILIVVNKGQLEQYKKLLGNGKNLGIKIRYVEQDKPRGLPDAFILGENFIKNDNIAMILGDNFFYGQSLTKTLLECVKIKNGCKIILHKVVNPEKFGVAIDAKKSEDKWEVFTHGGRNNTGIDAIEFAKKMEDSGAGELLVTSMDRDGTQIGFDIDLTSKISSKVNIPVIASGGVGNLDHLVEGIKLGNASAVLAASIFHYGKYSVKEAKEYLNSKGIPVRI